MNNRKLTINQITEVVLANVKGVVQIKKQPGTNNWFVFVQNRKDVKPAIKALRKLNFQISDKLLKISLEHKNIMAHFEGIPETYYGRQITGWDQISPK